MRLQKHPKVDSGIYQQWFSNLIPVRLENKKLILGVQESFFGDWLQNAYSDVIAEVLRNVDGQDYDYDLEEGHMPPPPPQICAENETTGDLRIAPVPSVVPSGFGVRERSDAPYALPANGGVAPVMMTTMPSTGGAATDRRMAFFERYTFESFVVGEENRYAYTAAMRAADCPGVFNPLYIYGSSGVGKTHLLHAVANRIRKNNPGAIVRYATCEEILNKFVESLATKRHGEFRSMLRDVDVLLVDDIHMLANKRELQEQFFNAFNVLYSENKQIILTSDKRPAEITGLEARLISRFEMGVQMEIFAPGFETRLAILRGVQEEQLVHFDEDVLEFVASRISSNVRRLRGALFRLVAIASVSSDRRITVEIADELLHKTFEEEHSSSIISIEDIQRTVAEHFGLRQSDLLSDKRPKSIAEPRMVAMFLSRKLTDHSFPQIGSAFGRNHATIMNACQKVPELCRKNEELRRAVALLERQLTAQK